MPPWSALGRKEGLRLWNEASVPRVLLATWLCTFSFKRLVRPRLPHRHSMTTSLVAGHSAVCAAMGRQADHAQDVCARTDNAGPDRLVA